MPYACRMDLCLRVGGLAKLERSGRFEEYLDTLSRISTPGRVSETMRLCIFHVASSPELSQLSALRIWRSQATRIDPSFGCDEGCSTPDGSCMDAQDASLEPHEPRGDRGPRGASRHA